MLKEPIAREEAYQATLEYFNKDELATDVWLNKYALRDHEDNYYEKTPDDMHWRLAYEFARPDVKYEFGMEKLPSKELCLSNKNQEITEYFNQKAQEYYELFKNFKYIIPQGSPMAGLGNTFQIISLSNCFVVQTHDSYGGILKTDQELAHIFKRRGGCGTDLTPLRPENLPTSNAAQKTAGIVPFMERFSNTCREVATKGRRGAEMQTISVHHPQVEDFIKAKLDLKKVTGANISVKCTDEFMSSVIGNGYYEQRWPVDSDNPQIKKAVKAKNIWNLMMECSAKSSEPGIFFWDNIINNSPADCYKDEGFQTLTTNPCGELPLPDAGRCLLMLLNIVSFITNPYTENALFNWSLFLDTAKIAQRLMDNLVDLEIECIDQIIAKVDSDPEPYDVKKIELDLWKRIRMKSINGRRTGLGPTAIGDAIAALGMKYGSDESIEFIEELYKQKALSSYRSSIELAKSRGAFPIFNLDKEKSHRFLNRLWSEDPVLYAEYKKYGRRNIANLTTAPAGSTSLLAQLVPGLHGTSSGIEPVFMYLYKRRKKILQSTGNQEIDFVDELGDKWKEFTVYHSGLKAWMQINNKTKKNIEESPYYQATAMDIDWIKGVELQGRATKWLDHSLSRTQNLPNNITQEEVSKIYLAAYSAGCKGFTIYRDGSRSGVLVSTEDDSKRDSFEYIDAFKRPEYLDCEIHKVNIKGQVWVVLVGLIDGCPYELFGGMCDQELMKVLENVNGSARIRKRKYKTRRNRYDLYQNDKLVLNDILDELDNPNNAVLARFVSLSLRHGAKPSFLAEQLRKDPDASFNSFSKVLARVLKKYIEDGTKVSSEKIPGCQQPGQCNLVYQEGCVSCTTCGLSKCS